MKNLAFIMIIVLLSPVLMSHGESKGEPLGKLGYEIAHSIESDVNKLAYPSGKYSTWIQDPRRLTLLRVRPNDTIFGSSWLTHSLGTPLSYIFWTDIDTISFYGYETPATFETRMPDEHTAIENTKIDLLGQEYDPNYTGYFITHIIIIKDGKFTIKSHRTHKGRPL